MDRFKLKLLYLFCCLLVSSGLAAQDASYFVYIQHEKQLPFYVKLEGKMLSSSVKGYVILPKLPQGKVPVTIGFPKSEAPEQSYVLRLTGQRDYGFLLKNTGDNDYALYDLQTFATLKSGGGAPLQENVTVTRISNEGSTAEQKELINNVQADVEAALAKKADTVIPRKKGGFAEALDKVVTDDRPDDMPLEAPKPKPVPVVVAADPVPVVEDVAPVVTKKPKGRKNRKEREALTEEEKNLLSSVMEDEKKAAADEAVAVAPAVDSAVATITDVSSEAVPVKKERKPKKKKGQTEPEFIDFDKTTTPPAEPVAEKAAEVVTENVPPEEELSAKEIRDAKRQKRKEERAAAERAAFVKDSIANAEFNESVPVEEKKPTIKMVNSDCGKILEVDAFRKLLRTMNGKKNDDDMVDAFRKGTRSVCVSTEQIRALTQLIATEENRYQLLDAAYARTYDTQNFSTLGDLLKEDYYKGRFKAMLKK
ncbi:DUF4476 domain-containing protein [Chitinophaga niabensis]|uniref:DUF4476 domain-containing protein n=1 Tax=Chitinophaga niabensis TaxID=536979 RepID=UPI0031B9F3A2